MWLSDSLFLALSALHFIQEAKFLSFLSEISSWVDQSKTETLWNLTDQTELQSAGRKSVCLQLTKDISFVITIFLKEFLNNLNESKKHKNCLNLAETPRHTYSFIVFRSWKTPQPVNDGQDDSAGRPERWRRVCVCEVLHVRGGQEVLQTQSRGIQRHCRWNRTFKSFHGNSPKSKLTSFVGFRRLSELPQQSSLLHQRPQPGTLHHQLCHVLSRRLVVHELPRSQPERPLRHRRQAPGEPVGAETTSAWTSKPLDAWICFHERKSLMVLHRC